MGHVNWMTDGIWSPPSITSLSASSNNNRVVSSPEALQQHIRRSLALESDDATPMAARRGKKIAQEIS
jgi:hypothetical protein